MQLSTTSNARSFSAGSHNHMALATLAILLVIAFLVVIQLAGPEISALRIVTAVAVAIGGGVTVDAGRLSLQHPRG